MFADVVDLHINLIDPEGFAFDHIRRKVLIVELFKYGNSHSKPEVFLNRGLSLPSLLVLSVKQF